MPNELFYLNTLDKSFSNRKGVWFVLLLPCFLEIPVLNANSVDPDQMSHSGSALFAYVCLCWGFTAQLTQWGHVERGQFT